MTVQHLPSAATAADAQPATGCYRELSPREFIARTDLVVFLVKLPGDVQGFDRFRQVIAIEECREVDAWLPRLQPGQAIGLVCRDGGCSGRLAIRLSRAGHPIVHLAGGLWAWNDEFRGALPAAV